MSTFPHHIPREVVLRELGLTPIWSLRNAPNVVEAHDVPPRPAQPTSSATAISAKEVIAPEQDAQIAIDREAAIAKMSWQELRASIQSCTACARCKTRTHALTGSGDEGAALLVLTSAPNSAEDAANQWLGDPEGVLFDAMLKAVSRSRGRGVYITGAVKCFAPTPSNTKDAESTAIQACRPYLLREIELSGAKTLLTLLDSEDSAQLSSTPEGTAPLSGGQNQHQTISTVEQVFTYHPLLLLTQPALKRQSWAHLLKAEALISSAPAAP